MAVYVLAIAVTRFWDGLWALPETPHYVAMFSVLSAFGSVSMAFIYFLLSVGAIRGLADHPKRWAVLLAAAVGMVVTGAAVFGSVYQVSKPTIYAPIGSLIIFVVALVAASASRSTEART